MDKSPDFSYLLSECAVLMKEKLVTFGYYFL